MNHGGGFGFQIDKQLHPYLAQTMRVLLTRLSDVFRSCDRSSEFVGGDRLERSRLDHVAAQPGAFRPQGGRRCAGASPVEKLYKEGADMVSHTFENRT